MLKRRVTGLLSSGAGLRWVGCAVSFCFAWASPEAQATIPPSAFLIKGMTNKRTQAKGVRLRSTVRSVDAGTVGAHQFTQVLFWDPQQRSLRARAMDTAGAELYSMERRMTSAGVEEQELLTSVLFDSQAAMLSLHLKKAGIPVKTDEELLLLKDEDERRRAEVESLGKIRNQIFWVIGKSRDTTEPQLWIEKDGFVPARLIYKTDDGMTDIRMESFRFQGSLGYPGILTASRAGEGEKGAWMREELQELNVSSDPRELKGSIENGFTEAGRSADPALRELIKRYYKVVR